MNAVLQTARALEEFCGAQGWRFCLIGGLAVQRWGQPRVTVDVDLTLLTGFGSEEPFVDALLNRFAGRREDARDFALRYRVVLAQSPAGVGIDVSLGALPFEERAVQRSSMGQFGPDLWLRTCSADDLVVMKALAGRDQDWMDVKSVLVRQGERLDWRQIREELQPLCELAEKPGVMEHLQRICRELADSEKG